MADGSGSEVQKDVLFGNGLLPTSMGGRLHVYHNHMEISSDLIESYSARSDSVKKQRSRSIEMRFF